MFLAVVFALAAAMANAVNLMTQHKASIGAPRRVKGWRLALYLPRQPLWPLGVALAPVRGVETHQRWHAVRHDNGPAELSRADERALRRGDVATLVPPNDVHNHGHVAGTGPTPYSLILAGRQHVGV